MPSFRSFAMFLALACATSTFAASARTTLVQSRPQQDGVLSNPTALDLTFSDSVAPADLSITLVMTGMPGMANHKPMAIKGFEVIPDGTKVSLRFPRPLPTGTYRMDWTVRGDPGGHDTGSLTFKVT
jgi:methionine-rich copper-binding protein CopC